MSRKSIDARFEEPDILSVAPKRGFNSSVIGGALGLAAGVAGGWFYAGEEVRNYFEALRYSSQQIQYSIKVFSSLICGGVGLIVFSALGQVPGMYRRPKKKKK